MDDIFIVEISAPIKYHFFIKILMHYSRKKKQGGVGGGGGVRKEFLGVKKEHVKVPRVN